ncbi:hypothetical protein [Actinomadura keratinilytica]|uniref:hypothetical protein n=1 Tax=Actinomadura keratinilytica TaxID=547461 RepID=UPI00360C0D2B
MSDDAYGDPQPAASGLAAPRRALSVRLPSLARAPEPGPDEMAPGPTVARMLLGRGCARCGRSAASAAPRRAS